MSEHMPTNSEDPLSAAARLLNAADVDDFDDCEVCSVYEDDFCPYHRGMISGQAAVFSLLRCVLDDPEWAFRALEVHKRAEASSPAAEALLAALDDETEIVVGAGRCRRCGEPDPNDLTGLCMDCELGERSADLMGHRITIPETDLPLLQLAALELGATPTDDPAPAEALSRLVNRVSGTTTLTQDQAAALHARRQHRAEPIPMRLPCPSCSELHVDDGQFATRPHHTHACQHCGMVWRPAVVPTVGVRFLPGFADSEEATDG